jgi:hypothetical protein
MALVLLLCCVAALLALALAGIALGRRPEACDIVYGSSLGLCLIAFVVALGQLLAGGTSALVLPVGLHLCQLKIQDVKKDKCISSK